MRNVVRKGVWWIGLGAWGLLMGVGAQAATTRSCSGDPVTTLGAFQQALKAAQNWDDTSYDTHLSRAARQRLSTERAKVDFSARLGQGAPLQGWAPKQSIEQRQATALRMLQDKVAAWPLADGKVHRQAGRAMVHFKWSVEGQYGEGDNAVATHQERASEVRLVCEAGQWRVDSEKAQIETSEVSLVKGRTPAGGLPAKESWVWP
jgi:hypothetical protein